MKEFDPAATEITGLEHLEGMEVGVIGDGYVDASKYDGNALTVTEGKITLPEPRSRVVVGLEYYPLIQTLDVNVQGLNDSLTGEKLNVTQAVLYFLETPGVQIGKSEDRLSDATYRTPLQDNNLPIAGKTGPQKLALKGKYALGANVIVTQQRPLQFDILGIELLGDLVAKKDRRRSE